MATVVGMEKNAEVRRSFQEYATDLGKWGWVVIVCGILGEIATVVLFVWGLWHAPKPDDYATWIWLLFALVILGLLIVPFIAFHKRRVAFDEEKSKLENAIREIQSGSNPRLRLLFNKSTGIQIGVFEEVLYRVSVELLEAQTIPRMRCQLTEIELIGNRDPETSRRLRYYRGRYLLKRHDRESLSDHPMDSGNQVEFDLIGESEDLRDWKLFFTPANEGCEIIPKNHYRLTVTVSGTRAKSDTKIFEAYSTPKGRLMVKEIEQEPSRAEHAHPPVSESD